MKASRTLDVRLLTFDERLLIAPNYLDWSRISLRNRDALDGNAEVVDKERLPGLYREIKLVLSQYGVPTMSTQLSNQDIALLYGEEPKHLIIDHLGLMKKEDGQRLQAIFNDGTVYTLSYPARTGESLYPTVFFVELKAAESDQGDLRRIVEIWHKHKFMILTIVENQRYYLQPVTVQGKGSIQYFAVYREHYGGEEIGLEVIHLDATMGIYIPWEQQLEDYLVERPEHRPIGDYIKMTSLWGVLPEEGEELVIYWNDSDDKRWRVIGVGETGLAMLTACLKQSVAFEHQVPMTLLLISGKMTYA